MKKNIDITIIYTIAGIAITLSVLLFFYIFWPQSAVPTSIVSVPIENNTTATEDCVKRNILDGVCVSKEKDEQQKIVAVMIENHFDSWPQSGLSGARVVYEAPVEGNISRFMALYLLGDEVKKIGPVRSARPYYLDWLEEYGTPLYMHVGGSPEALQKIQIKQINDLNEFYRGWYYWRDTARYAPHNVYTSSDLWNDAIKKYEENYTTSMQGGWTFADSIGCQDECITEIAIAYSGNTYTTGWKYSSSTEHYTRYQAGQMSLDSMNNKPIVADTVLIQYVDTTVLDGVGRLGMDTIGSGKGIVFQKGNMIEGTWKKDSAQSKTRWFTAENTEVALQPGKIWIQIINRDTVTVK